MLRNTRRSPSAHRFATAGKYLRLSITSRCNLRCRYCIPKALPIEASLSDGEIVALVREVSSVAPLRKVRLTGGEPLLRPRLPTLIAELRQTLPTAQICLTTNGTLLARFAADLRRAGLDALNISLDSPEPSRFAALTGRDSLGAVLEGLAAARAAGFERLKMNAVLLRSTNGDSLAELVRVARSAGAELRFIELMPLGAAAALFEREYLAADEALAELGRTFTLLGPAGWNGTARRERLRDEHGEVTVGFIAPISHPFCSSCDRIRLDARGRLFACLRSHRGAELAGPLRAGDCDELRRRVRSVLDLKRRAEPEWPGRSMAAIGG